MEFFKKEFLQKASLIIKDQEKLESLEKILTDLIVKCIKIYDIREGVILLDENKKILEFNEKIKDFNISPSFIGKSIYELFDEEFRDVIDKFFDKLDKKKFNKKNGIYLKVNNKEIMADISAEIIHIDNKKYYIISLLQKEINSVTYKLDVIEEQIANLIVRVKDFESLMKEILNIFINSTLFDFGWVAKVDLELKEIIPVVTMEEKDIDLEFKKKTFDFHYFKGILDILLRDEEIII